MRGTIKQRFVFRSVEYTLRQIYCNKKTCTTCPHGPYWYAKIAVPGTKPSVRYIGKALKGHTLQYYENNRAAVEVLD